MVCCESSWFIYGEVVEQGFSLGITQLHAQAFHLSQGLFPSGARLIGLFEPLDVMTAGTMLLQQARAIWQRRHLHSFRSGWRVNGSTGLDLPIWDLGGAAACDQQTKHWNEHYEEE